MNQSRHNGIEFGALGIDLKAIFTAFEKNVVTDPLSAVFAVGCLKEILCSDDKRAASEVFDRYTHVNKVSQIQQLLDINKKKDDIKRVFGTNFGCPVIGFYDYPLSFL